MNEHELESFESELRALKPAAPPRELMARLEAARPARKPARGSRPVRPPRPAWVEFLQWVVPTTAVAGLMIAWAWWLSAGGEATRRQADSAPPTVAAGQDQVEISRELVASYDAIAELANGEPVRFRCREWQEEVVFRDPGRGIAIERRAPRFEIIPVGLEVY